jgi:ATP-dependent RNA helicase DeaD
MDEVVDDAGSTKQGGPQAIEHPAPSEAEVDLAEIYVNVGRRDGARAADFQQILIDRAGLERANVRRIRVRERNAFVSVRRDDLDRALAALQGATVAGKVAMAEQARERGADDPVAMGASPFGGPVPMGDTPMPPAEPVVVATGPEPGSHSSAASSPLRDVPAPPGESPTPPSSDDSVPTNPAGGHPEGAAPTASPAGVPVPTGSPGRGLS